MIIVPVRRNSLAGRVLWAFRLFVGVPLLLIAGLVALFNGGNKLVALALIGLPIGLVVQEIRSRR